jgi:hypothetical protein
MKELTPVIAAQAGIQHQGSLMLSMFSSRKRFGIDDSVLPKMKFSMDI